MADQEAEKNSAAVRKIIDHAQLHQITEKLFVRFPLHVVENNQKNPVRAIGYSHPHLEVVHQLPAGVGRTLLLVKDDNSMMLECSIVERTDRGTEILKPMRLFISKRGVRHENRTPVEGGQTNGDLVGQVRHVIPHSEFYRVNAGSNSVRDTIFAQYKKAIREIIPNVQVVVDLQRANRQTVRLKKLSEFNLPIFAPVMSRQRNADEQSIVAMPYSEYEQVMRADGLPGDYIGEICEPLRYRGALIFGYLQILSLHEALTVKQYHSVRQLARRLEQDLYTKRCFPDNPIDGKILDVSPNGIGFVYTGQRNLLSPTAVGDKIVFDAHFAADNITTLSAKIMNMTSLENGKRYGVEFENISEDAQAALKKVTQ
ncbi:MAG: PilZ domain-containing protein [Spirochaetes bacterium]|nr:PilZ domain-containing protein [Spirochaetota bacterium]